MWSTRYTSQNDYCTMLHTLINVMYIASCIHTDQCEMSIIPGYCANIYVSRQFLHTCHKCSQEYKKANNLDFMTNAISCLDSVYELLTGCHSL